MTAPRFLDEIASKFAKLAESSPAKDIEKNAKAMLGGAFDRLDLVTREDFDVQREVLAQTRERLHALEARVAELESELARSRAGE